MRLHRLKAGHTLWAFGANGGLMSFEVITSRYNDHRGIDVECWNNSKPEREKPQTININRFGFLQFDNSYEREIGERTTMWWSRVYRTRSEATRRVHLGRPVVLSFDKMSEEYGYQRAAEIAGLKSKFLPFRKRDVATRQARALDRIMNQIEEKRATQPTPCSRTEYSYEVVNGNKIVTKREVSNARSD